MASLRNWKRCRPLALSVSPSYMRDAEVSAAHTQYTTGVKRGEPGRPSGFSSTRLFYPASGPHPRVSQPSIVSLPWCRCSHSAVDAGHVPPAAPAHADKVPSQGPPSTQAWGLLVYGTLTFRIPRCRMDVGDPGSCLSASASMFRMSLHVPATQN